MSPNEQQSTAFSKIGENLPKSIIDHDFLLMWHAICTKFFSIPNGFTFSHSIDLDPIFNFEDYENFIENNYNKNEFERNKYAHLFNVSPPINKDKEPSAVAAVFHGSSTYGRWLNQWIMKNSSTNIDDNATKYNYLAYTIISSILSTELETIPFEFFENIVDKSKHENGVMINYIQIEKNSSEPLLKFEWNQKFYDMCKVGDAAGPKNENDRTGYSLIDRDDGENKNIVININYNATFNKEIIAYSEEFREWYDHTSLKKLLDDLEYRIKNDEKNTTITDGESLFKRISDDFKKLSTHAALYYYDKVKPNYNHPKTTDNLYDNLKIIVKTLESNNNINAESEEHIKFIKSIQFMIFLMNLFEVKESHIYFPKLKIVNNDPKKNERNYLEDKITLFIIIFGPYKQDILEEINEYYTEFYKEYAKKSLGLRFVDSRKTVKEMIDAYELRKKKI